MIRKSFTLPDEIYNEVKKIAKKEGKTFSAVIREAVDLVIAKYKSK